MTLILDLSDELETRLRTAARAEGTDEAEAVRLLLERALPPIEAQPEAPSRDPDSAERVRRAEALFAEWAAEDEALTDEEVAQEAREWQTFQENMNANRAANGEGPVF